MPKRPGGGDALFSSLGNQGSGSHIWQTSSRPRGGRRCARGVGSLLGAWWCTTYWPWTEALRIVIGEGSLDGVEELAQLLPERSGPSIETAPEHADATRFRLFEAVVRLLRSVSCEQPLVIVLEDVHTADEPSLVLLEFVIRALASLRVLMVATYRDVELVADSPFMAVLSDLMRDRATPGGARRPKRTRGRRGHPGKHRQARVKRDRRASSPPHRRQSALRARGGPLTDQ